MRKVLVTIVSALAALATCGPAAAVDFGVADERGKDFPGDTRFLDALSDLGLTENRISIVWNPDQPLTIPNKDQLDAYVQAAAARRVRLIFAVYPGTARVLTDYPEAPGQFVDFLQLVARTYPMVNEVIVGNEPNQPRFWQPQYTVAGAPVACRTYAPLLARSYDALKAVNPNMIVIGVALSPRGNDNPFAQSNISTSPVRCIRDIGAAYRASKRKRPIMDEFSYHPYPERDTHPLSRGYVWPKAGLVNLSRIKQAIWDAFNGTAQPTFDEPGARSVVLPTLKFRLDELGWQVGIPQSVQHAYFGRESVETTDEATQARIYSEALRLVACDNSVRSVLFFGLVDEPDLERWQAALMRVDWSRRPAYDAVKSTIAQTGGRCSGASTIWRHATTVVGASWGYARPKTKRGKTLWSFAAKVGEDALFRAAVLRVTSLRPIPPRGRRAMAQLLQGRAPGVLFRSGIVRAPFGQVFRFQPRAMKPGNYVLAVLLQAEMNPKRTTLFVGKPFRVGKVATPKKKPKRKG